MSTKKHPDILNTSGVARVVRVRPQKLKDGVNEMLQTWY